MKKSPQPLQMKKQAENFFLEKEGKTLRTPKGNFVAIPSEKLALAVIREQESLNNHNGFLSKLCFTALDYIIPGHSHVIESAVYQLDHDTLLHWSELPKELHAAQQERWLPLIVWFGQKYEIELDISYSLHLQHQSTSAKQQFGRMLQNLDLWHLTGFLGLAQELSSSILACAVYQQEINTSQALELSLLEEKVQIGKWGDDPFLQKKRQLIEQECLAAQQFLKLLN